MIDAHALSLLFFFFTGRHRPGRPGDGGPARPGLHGPGQPAVAPVSFLVMVEKRG